MLYLVALLGCLDAAVLKGVLDTNACWQLLFALCRLVELSVFYLGALAFRFFGGVRLNTNQRYNTFFLLTYSVVDYRKDIRLRSKEWSMEARSGVGLNWQLIDVYLRAGITNVLKFLEYLFQFLRSWLQNIGRSVAPGKCGLMKFEFRGHLMSSFLHCPLALWISSKASPDAAWLCSSDESSS